jgi:hypothetical protein
MKKGSACVLYPGLIALGVRRGVGRMRVIDDGLSIIAF